MSQSTLASALMKNPDIIHLVFESMPEPTFLINKHGVYLEAWGGTDTSRHHSPSTLIGLNQYDVLPEHLAHWFSSIIIEVIESGVPKELEYDLHPKDLPCFKGQEGPTELQQFNAFVVPLSDLNMVLWTVRNITEYKSNIRRLAQHQSELEKLTFTDHLTQVHNRFALESLLPTELKHAEIEQHDTAIFMIDIDHFKQLNDHYGHIKGDEALKQIGKQLNDWIDDNGVCFRYGGDEFLVFIRNISRSECQQKAQVLLSHVSQLRIPNINSPISPHLSITIGIKHCSYSNDAMDLEQIVMMADQALLYAKQRQRGTIHILT